MALSYTAVLCTEFSYNFLFRAMYGYRKQLLVALLRDTNFSTRSRDYVSLIYSLKQNREFYLWFPRLVY